LYRSEGTLEQALESSSFLNTEDKKSAAVYSFLTGDNLAWLYRWVGANVTDAEIKRAMDYFSDQHVILPSE